VTTRPTVIITDGEQRAALAAVRSLGQRYRCVVVASSPRSLAAGSRYCMKAVVLRDALKEPSEFAADLIELAASERASLILPISEAALLAILPVKNQLAPAIVPFPDIATFTALTDKRRLLEDASHLGIAIPAQRVIANRSAADTVDLGALRFPVVLKPARSVGMAEGRLAKVSVSYATNANDLRRKVGKLSAAAFPLLVQERIVGPGTGIFVLLWGGEVRAAFAHRRLSEKPPAGGVSVYRESIPLDQKMLEQSVALLRRFGWEGVAMIEYKRDARTGQPYLMEINGRFWGSLQLAIDAGVDFPMLLASYALGAQPGPQPAYSVGIRSRWWWGQVDHLVGRVGLRGERAVPPGTRSASRALADLLVGPFRRQDYEEIFWWNDPRPFWNETVRWIGAR
jgi:predicted ATP-grasp superfamily ATP-dependent carboligase